MKRASWSGQTAKRGLRELTTQEPEIVCELRSSSARQPVTDGTTKEQDQDHSGSDPKWAV